MKSWEICPMRHGIVRRPGLPRLAGRKEMIVIATGRVFWEVRMWTDLRSGVVIDRAHTAIPLTIRKTR